MITYPARGREAPIKKYEGAVLTTRERNFPDDSDFYALAWDGQKIVTEEYATTRYGGGGDATVDATPEIQKLADAWAYKTLRKEAWAGYVRKLDTPEKGDTVIVTKGKAAPKGTRGKLFWIGEEQIYGGYTRWAQTRARKIGIALTEEKDDKGRYKDVVWTYLANVKADRAVKFKLADAKAVLKRLKAGGWKTYLAYQAYPLQFFG